MFVLQALAKKKGLKEYSFTEFFKLIEAEKDAVFTLKDAFVKFDSKKDSSFYFEESAEGYIKFYRKIRQNLLNEAKTTKYVKYAIGEIVLVVIGILIAL